MDFFSYINPLKHFNEGQYISFWQMLFATLLQGFWAKFLATGSLILAFWFGVRRQRFVIGVIFFFCAISLAYGAVVLKITGLIK
jgi:hypothetical protein